MEAAGYEPKERTHSNIPTFCWLWVTSGNNRTAAEAQQNTNECWWKAGSVPEMLGCWCGVGGMNMCPWPALNRSNTKPRDSLPTPQGFILQKGRWIWQFATIRSRSVKPGKELKDGQVLCPHLLLHLGMIWFPRKERACGSSIACPKPHRSARATMPGIRDTPLWLW